MQKKIVYGVIIGIIIIAVIFIILLAPILKVLGFFDSNVTDGYVENNSEYADDYRNVVSDYIKAKKGYVSLERVLYFYNADNSLSFEEIYKDNLDNDSKQMLPISQVCDLEKYSPLDVCDEDRIEESNQINVTQAKPFEPPIDFSKIKRVSSFFMEERVVFGKSDQHNGWDLSAEALTPVYATCNGVAEKVSFPYQVNAQDIGSNGNEIRIRCDGNNYLVTYAHLFPNSNKITEGQVVNKGQEIAGVGTTGTSTNNHLHYQVSLDGKLVDGMSLVDFNS